MAGDLGAHGLTKGLSEHLIPGAGPAPGFCLQIPGFVVLFPAHGLTTRPPRCSAVRVVKQSLGTVGYQQAEPGAAQKWLLGGERNRAEDQVENPCRPTGRVPVSRHIDDENGWSSGRVTSAEVARDVAMTTSEWMSSEVAIEEARVIAGCRRGTGAASWRGGVPSGDAGAPMQERRR